MGYTAAILPPPPKKKIVPNGKLMYDTCMTNKQTYYKKKTHDNKTEIHSLF